MISNSKVQAKYDESSEELENGEYLFASKVIFKGNNNNGEPGKELVVDPRMKGRKVLDNNLIPEKVFKIVADTVYSLDTEDSEIEEFSLSTSESPSQSTSETSSKVTSVKEASLTGGQIAGITIGTVGDGCGICCCVKLDVVGVLIESLFLIQFDADRDKLGLSPPPLLP